MIIDPSTTKLSPPRIICAALKHDVTGRIVAGPRHFDPTMRSQFMPGEKWAGAIQGFIDQHGEFHSRLAAFNIARKNGQIINDLPGAADNILFSEHLY